MYWNYKAYGKPWGSPAHSEKKYGKPLNTILSSEDDPVQLHLVRTYLQKIAGELDESKFDSKTGHFTGTYFAIPGGETVLYLGKQKVYGNGYMITVYPENETDVR